MASIQDVAAFFIELGQAQANRGSGDLVTPLQLEKLLYFAQGWHLARFSRPLFVDDFYAWEYGPVVPDMYHEYKAYGRGGIETNEAPRSAEKLTESEYDLLLDVAREYMKYSASGLVALTHEKDSPWQNTERNGLITKQSMQAYFSSLPPISTFDDILDGYPIEEL